ncbi:hypothetical protein ABTJ83_20375, partial [Acinetobacter baumannii]
MNLETHQKVNMVTTLFDEQPFEWMIEYVPAFTTVTVFYDPLKISDFISYTLPYDYVCGQLKPLLESLKIGEFSSERI